MNIQSLITTVVKDAKPLPLAQDQFEFTIDRAGRKVARPVVDFLAKKELIRVQTQRPYQLTLVLDLPDATAGTLRPIQCQVIIDGAIDRSVEAARAFVEAGLQSDFDWSTLIIRLLERTLTEVGTTLNPPASFIRMLRTPQGPTGLQGQLLGALQRAHLGAKRLVLTPLAIDTRPQVSLEDEANTLEIRPQDQLRKRHVGYKARLQWGKEEEQVLGRLGYRGTLEGREPGPSLEAALVSGQIQPLEAWFRVLLGEALSQQPWQAICSADATAMAQVMQAVSQALGRGTGRVLQTLKVYPALDTTLAGPESSMRFFQSYSIGGMKGAGLEVDHAIRYTLEDLSRWEACKSPDPQTFLKQQVIEATRLFLLDMRFEDIVALYLSGVTGEKRLCEAIEKRVTVAAEAIGHLFTPVATILTIPQMDFVQGRTLTFPERSFALATANISPAITIHATVRVRKHGDGGVVFARALARDDDFDKRVQATIEDIVRTHLRGVEALQYYASHYVNGVGVVQNAKTGEWVSLSRGDRQFQRDMCEAIDTALSSHFGLETIKFDLVPGADRLISRMQQLSHLPITYEEELKFARDSHKTVVNVHVHARLFVASIDTQNWDGFYRNAMRLSDDEHRQKISETLHDVLQQLEGLVTDGGTADLKESGVQALVIGPFTQTMSEQFGLVVRLRPLLLRVRRPRVGQVAGLMVDELEQELRKILELRRETDESPRPGYSRTPTRDSLTARIKQIRAELQEAATEHEADLARAEHVRIEQDLLPAPRPGTSSTSQ